MARLESFLMLGPGLHLGPCLVEQIVKFPMTHLRKETIIKLLWSISTLLVRGHAIMCVLFGWTRQPPYFYLVAALHKGLPARQRCSLEGRGVLHGIRWLLLGKALQTSLGTQQAVLMQLKHWGKNCQRGRPSQEAPHPPTPRPKTPGGAKPGSKSLVCLPLTQMAPHTSGWV